MMHSLRRDNRRTAGYEPTVVLTDDHLVYCRPSGARTELDLADLTRVTVFAVGSGQCFWHIEGKGCSEAIVPLDVPGESLIRQYLSQWRGFDYDGLVRFVSAEKPHGQTQVWPLPNY
ncbi:hypothetical protein [Saccharospirillum impatiens]|uniref:hypothetical protein n=1 Tax=Saccharospirillum impatiens TaxID=169438 RepID=UPI0003FD82CF|nr:hypothetical protein [Saccharospirillum impatiens]